MSNFKVGDKVKVVKAAFSPEFNGNTGTIDAIDEKDERARYRVITDRGFLVWCVSVEPVKEKRPVIVITTDGKTTTATMRQGKTILKTASARCGKRDSFDFAEGARIAFERLQGREPFQPEPSADGGSWPEKVVCLRSDFPWFKPGTVYPVFLFFGFHAIRDKDPITHHLPWILGRDGDLFDIVGATDPDRSAVFAPLTED